MCQGAAPSVPRASGDEPDQGFILSGRLPEALVEPGVKYNAALAVFGACFLASLGIVRSPLNHTAGTLRFATPRMRAHGLS